MARAALAHSLGRDLDGFADPFGTTLRSDTDSTPPKVWSVGRDGDDGGGSGDDLVVELGR